MTPYNTDISASTTCLAICFGYDSSDRYEYKRILRESSPIQAMPIWRAVGIVDDMRIARLIGQ